MSELTERRARDRATMADKLQAMAESMGATVIRPDPLGAGEIRLEIEMPGGAYLPVEFDGQALAPDCHVLTWNVRTESMFAFSGAAGLDVNQFHFRKASALAYGFAELCDVIALHLEAFSSGRAYSAERAAKRARLAIERHESALRYLEPMAARGDGCGAPGEVGAMTPADVRAAVKERLPFLISQLESFIAAGCPVENCNGFAWH